jgi:hypothetical protein
MNFADLIAEDRVWRAICDGLVTRRTKPTATGWTNFSCPLCSDRRNRCGVRNLGFQEAKCFNCQFYTRFTLGSHLGYKMQDFLIALGVSQKQVQHAKLWAEQMRRFVADDPAAQRELDILVMPNLPTAELPIWAQSLDDWAEQDCENPHYCAAVAYLYKRGHVAANATTYYWTPETERHLHRRLIIPCYQDDRLIGWTARAIDDRQPRYIKELPSNYLFNAQFLTGPRQYVFIVEGVFDALVIDGVAALGGTLNERQIAWINQSDKRPVVVPDRDRSGSHLIDVAIQQHWAVAGPHFGRHQWWDADVKDADDAVRRYGKLYVMQSILATQETHPGKILQRASYLVR